VIRAAILAATAALAGCGAPERSVTEFAADPETAERVVADCDAGRARRDCESARRGLADTRRRERMAAYERAF
jgi:hypothetical protein